MSISSLLGDLNKIRIISNIKTAKPVWQVHCRTGLDNEAKLKELEDVVLDFKKNNPDELPDPKTPFTTDYIIKVLSEDLKLECFATGSRVFGCASSESDYDIVIRQLPVSYDVLDKLGDTYGHFVTEDSNYNNGSKMYFGHRNDKCINIIPLSNHDYLYWMLATHSIANMARINPKGISNKTVRVSTFEMMKGLARLIVGNEVDESTIKKYRDMLKKDENVVISKWQYSNSKKKDNDEE